MIYKIKITDTVSHEITEKSFMEIWEKCKQARENMTVSVDVFQVDDIHIIISSWARWCDD